jgi:hypothetical protein
MYSLALIIFVVSEKKAFEHFPIVKMAATAGLSLTLDPMGKMFQNASSLKPLGQLKPNFPGMIIGRSVSIVQVVSEKKRFETFSP